MSDKEDSIIFIREYLDFKEECVKRNIFDIEEIIKLWRARRLIK